MTSTSPPTTDSATPTEALVEFWEGHYGQRDQIWSGNVNPVLAREAEKLPPARALDLGCGEGGDAIWLAQRGWSVTAVDISITALARGSIAAEAAGVADLIDWQQHDLGATFPSGEFDLVSAQFLQSPVELDRDRILARASAAVAPGGRLLIVGHAAFPAWSGMHHSGEHLPSADEVRLSLNLEPDRWQTLLSQTETRAAVDPEGQPTSLDDSVVLVLRSGVPQQKEIC